jgi:hypothetical protein
MNRVASMMSRIAIERGKLSLRVTDIGGMGHRPSILEFIGVIWNEIRPLARRTSHHCREVIEYLVSVLATAVREIGIAVGCAFEEKQLDSLTSCMATLLLLGLERRVGPGHVER